MSTLLQLAAVVLFALAALLLLLTDGVLDTAETIGLIALGLACWAAVPFAGGQVWTRQP